MPRCSRSPFACMNTDSVCGKVVEESLEVLTSFWNCAGPLIVTLRGIVQRRSVPYDPFGLPGAGVASESTDR